MQKGVRIIEMVMTEDPIGQANWRLFFLLNLLPDPLHGGPKEENSSVHREKNWKCGAEAA